MSKKSIFVECSSLTPAQLTTMLEAVRSRYQAGEIYNLVLTAICDDVGNLYTDQLDAIRPFLPGGSRVACDNVYVGTNWKAFTPAAYGLDMSKWYNHYAVWGGMLTSRYRWDQITLSAKAWADFKARYNLPWMHFYLSNEADLESLGHPTLGPSVSAGIEALLIELCRQAKAVESPRSVLWSPFCWTPYRSVPADTKTRMGARLGSLLRNVKNYSGMGINFLDPQDSVGARPGITFKEDAAALYDAIHNANGVYMGMNVEQFRATGSGFVASPAISREAWYLQSRGIPAGACWELRYWYQNLVAVPPTPPPAPSYPRVEYLSRSQWGARTDLPRLGYFVPADRRTELHVHHTASIDGNDSTPNRWSRAEAIRYMKILQTVRPDLGLDIPYTDVFFILEDLSVLICEGRGRERTGAHTAGHNTAGFGWSVGGNFDKADPEARDALLAVIQNEARYLRSAGFPRLCSSKNPKGWDVWGHRDTAPKSCPGSTLYPSLAGVKVVL